MSTHSNKYRDSENETIEIMGINVYHCAYIHFSYLRYYLVPKDILTDFSGRGGEIEKS